MTDKNPSPRQVIGAAIRAERERYEKKHRKRHGGGWEIPATEKVYAHLARMFNLDPVDVSYFMTWSRSCQHPWSAGACPRCPE